MFRTTHRRGFVVEEKEIVPVAKSVSFPSDWWESFSEAARKEGISTTAWIGMACRNFLPDPIACKLSPKNQVGRKPVAKKAKKPATGWRALCMLCRKNPKTQEGYCDDCFKQSYKYKDGVTNYIKAVNDSQKANPE